MINTPEPVREPIDYSSVMRGKDNWKRIEIMFLLRNSFIEITTLEKKLRNQRYFVSPPVNIIY